MGELCATINSVPAAAWIGLLGVIFGALLASITACLTNRANLKQLKLRFKHEEVVKEKQIKLERLEELYILFSQWHVALIAEYASLIPVFGGRLTIENYKAGLTSAKASLTPEAANRRKMIVEVYGKEFKEDHSKVFRLADRLALSKFEYLNGERATTTKAYIDEYSAVLEDFYKSGEGLLEVIAKTIHET